LCNDLAGDFKPNQLIEEPDNQFADSLQASASYLPSNVHTLQITNASQSRNYTCQAQNSFGLVVFNLTLVIKGNFYVFCCCLFVYLLLPAIVYLFCLAEFACCFFSFVNVINSSLELKANFYENKFSFFVSVVYCVTLKKEFLV